MIDEHKFEAPFVGLWNTTANHKTTLVHQGDYQARIQHDEDDLTYYTTIHWDSEAFISGPLPGTHRYVLTPQGCNEIILTVSYHNNPSPQMGPYYSPQGQGTRMNTAAASIRSWSSRYWRDYWEKGAFVDLTRTGNESAIELQRRIVQT